MSKIKLISFEMQMEFDIGETDYSVVWSLDNNMNDINKYLGLETGSNIIDETKEENVFKESFEAFKAVIEEAAFKEQPASETNQEEKEKKTIVDEINKKENTEEGINEIQENDEDKEDHYKEAHAKDETDGKEKERSVEESTENSNLEVTFDESSENQMIADEEWPKTEEDAPETATVDHTRCCPFECASCYVDIMVPETSSQNHPRKFNLKLGAGPISIKVSRLSSGVSGPPVFSQAVEGLEEEQLREFGRAWAEAVSVCLERRMAAGRTLEEVMAGLVVEMGLDRLKDIVEYFFGTITVEHVEDENDTQEDDGGDDNN